MFVVMTAGASEAEILGVKSQILAEGLTPFDHQDADHASSPSSARSGRASRSSSKRSRRWPGSTASPRSAGRSS